MASDPHIIRKALARNARTVTDAGTVRQEPAYITGWDARKANLKGPPLPDRLWSAVDHVRREDRLFAQGWHDADRNIKTGGGK